MAFTHETKCMIAIGIIYWTCLSPAMSLTLQDSSVAEIHEKWKAKYQRVYADEIENQKRFSVFKKNLEYVENFNNAGNSSHRLGLNRFSDLTTDEFLDLYTGFKNSTSSLPKASKAGPMKPFRLSDIPSEIDWRNKGAVTEIKYQGSCRSSWAFSAVAAVEGIVQISTGKLISLSEQQLVDCASAGGCDAGLMDIAFEYIKQNNGLASEDDYSYEYTEGYCENVMASYYAAQISGYEAMQPQTEEQLQAVVAQQPVSVAIAVGEAFKSYTEGIFSGPCGLKLNHAVAVIGYGVSEDGISYWLIKNSWGESWGENGFMKMRRNVGSRFGLCGIAVVASYPTV